MILFFEYGRLGNQLFQYYGLKNYFPKHKLVFFGCKSLQATFDNIDVSFIISENKYCKYLFRILKFFLYFLSSTRILGQIYQTQNNKSFKLKVFRGLFWNIYVARDIYFQANECIEKINTLPSFKNKNLRSAREFLKINKIDPKKSNLVFVHFRRGDYLFWPDPKYPAVLDLIWYKKAILLIKKRTTKPKFILMGDDLFYLKDFFEESKNVIISKNSYMVDLSIMSLCSSGILSASSYAWWGAYCSKLSNKKKNFFIGPKYWSGHRRKKWKPKNFYTKWIKYI